MSNAPVTHIDPARFAADPYPVMAEMRRDAPVTFVPELNATLFTRRDDIFSEEKRVSMFSSRQPEGLMTQLMGENLMRKDGDAHQQERRALFPALSPRTTRDVWLPLIKASTENILNRLKPLGKCDLVRDFAMPVSAEALKLVTGLTNMTAAEMDRVSQGMIDGCANYTGDPAVKANCDDCTGSIDAHIDEMLPLLRATPDSSALSIQMQAGLSEASVRANIKLIISGGQNEPRDAIAGAAYALLAAPDQLALARQGKWLEAFAEYLRWMSPIGMSPREIAEEGEACGVKFSKGDRVFFMLSSAGHDEAYFRAPEQFDLARDTAPSIPFGAGPHFCGGAAVARALITEAALPMLFEALPNLHLAGEAPFHGWAFRGPKQVPVAW